MRSFCFFPVMVDLNLTHRARTRSQINCQIRATVAMSCVCPCSIIMRRSRILDSYMYSRSQHSVRISGQLCDKSCTIICAYSRSIRGCTGACTCIVTAFIYMHESTRYFAGKHTILAGPPDIMNGYVYIRA